MNVFQKRRVLRGGVRVKSKLPGFYRKVIIHPIHPSPCFTRRVHLNRRFELFKKDLGTYILRELRKTGDGFSSPKNFSISDDLAKYLKRKYDLRTNWVDGMEFAAALNIPLRIRKALDTPPVYCERLEMKFGNKRKTNYFSGEDVRLKKSKFTMRSF